MSAKGRAALGYGLAFALMMVAVMLEGVQLASTMFGWQMAGLAAKITPGVTGYGAGAVLLLDVILALTVLFFLLAVALPQHRLSLVQGALTAIWGGAMIALGLVTALAALTELIRLVTMMLAFPFGTIAYFFEYSCVTAPSSTVLLPPAPGDPAIELMKGACFDGSIAAALLALLAKCAAFVTLLITSLRYATVTGLVLLFALSGALSIFVIAAFTFTFSLSFLLYPVDAGVTTVIALVAAIYGLVALIKGIIAWALALASQAS